MSAGTGPTATGAPHAASPIATAAIVAPSPVPLRLGGAERHWEALARTLGSRGIATDLVKLPVREYTLVDLLDAYEQFALLDLSHVDLVITGKYPAWMVSHPNHVVWMLHPLRGLYDTYNPAAFEGRRLPDEPVLAELAALLRTDPAAGDPFAVIDLVRAADDRLGPGASDPDGPLSLPGPLARAVVQYLDRGALDPSRVATHAAISEVVARRPDYFPPAVEVRVVHPPSCLPDPARPSPPGEGFITVSRLDAVKRVDLAIEAVRRLEGPTPTLTVVGDGPDRPRLEALAGGDPRIRFTGRIDDRELADLYLGARAVVVTPHDEDFGYVTIEAMQHGRAVLTCTDSGGPAELATEGIDALVVDPTAAAVAEAVDRLQHDAALAARLGEGGRRAAATHAWPVALDRLLEPPPGTGARAGRRGRLVAVSTYPILGWPGGGPERAGHLLGALAEDGWDVTIVALNDGGGTVRREIADGLRQVTVSPSERHSAAEVRLRRVTANVSVTDIAASVLWQSTPELVRELRHALSGADAAILVQPYLAGAVTALAPGLPVVFDAHNHERTLKAQMLPDDEAGHWMLDRVAEAEGLAASSAALVAVTTAEDRDALAADHGLAHRPIVVVPNGVDTASVPFTPMERRAAGRAGLLRTLDAPAGATRVAVFIGSAHRPNVEAGIELVRLAGRVPEVLFVLAGQHSDLIDHHGRPANVRLLGEVDPERLARLLATADVALNPMHTGGGSNLKLLGYFAAGVPVVTTRVGARGIEDPQRYAVLAERHGFADAIRESLRAENRDKVKAARDLVEARFDWSEIRRRFTEEVDRALGSRAGPPPAQSTTGVEAVER